jgi:hypothetical protein
MEICRRSASYFYRMYSQLTTTYHNDNEVVLEIVDTMVMICYKSECVKRNRSFSNLLEVDQVTAIEYGNHSLVLMIDVIPPPA